ncbi:MAG: hypothetical protein MI923_07620 [Phycisphaerales bacterium]|nr:hypothetical protein [Phycisphaerales bacterium]
MAKHGFTSDRPSGRSLPKSGITDKLPLEMYVSQMPTSEKPIRASALSGAVIALAAVVGIDCAVSASAIRSAHDTTGAVVRTIVPCNPSLLSAGTGLSWTVAALILFFLLRRVPSIASTVKVVHCSPDLPSPHDALSLLRRRHTISYHLGGLYGP